MGLHDGHRQRMRQQFLSHGPQSMADHELLELAGLRAYCDVLAERLVESAQSLGRQVAAVPLDTRAAWSNAARAALGLGMDTPVRALEGAVARIALE